MSEVLDSISGPLSQLSSAPLLTTEPPFIQESLHLTIIFYLFPVLRSRSRLEPPLIGWSRSWLRDLGLPEQPKKAAAPQHCLFPFLKLICCAMFLKRPRLYHLISNVIPFNLKKQFYSFSFRLNNVAIGVKNSSLQFCSI